jgi:hypothetical protein
MREIIGYALMDSRGCPVRAIRAAILCISGTCPQPFATSEISPHSRSLECPSSHAAPEFGCERGVPSWEPPAFCGNHAPGQRLGSKWLGLLVAALWWRPDLRPCQRRSNLPWLFSATPRSGNPSRGSPRCGEGAGRRWVSGAGTTSQGCSVFCARNHPGT